MRYRLINHNEQRHLTLDADLEQKRVFFCDKSFDHYRTGTLFDENEFEYFDELLGNIIVTLA